MGMNFQIGSFLKRTLLVGAVFYIGVTGIWAQTWDSTSSNDWNTVGNWDSGVPNSPSAMATFGDGSSVTIVTLSAGVSLDTLLFNGTTTTYSIQTSGNSVTFDGFGINNASGIQQTLVNGNDGNVLFTNSSQAVSILLTNAAASTITFQDSSSAGSATVLNNGILNFIGNASAGGAVISTNAGGAVSFTGSALGGQAQFTVNSGGLLDISGEAGGVGVGSIAGAGSFNLGANDLSTGANEMSTTVSGVISGTGGSLTTNGLGVTLTLTGQNTYTGGTSILYGTLVVDNGTLGTGAVNVMGGSATLNYADQSVAANIINNNGGYINFNNSSSAGPSTVTNGGFLNFNDSSAAGTANLTNNATVTFANSSTAASANITNSSGGRISFSDGSTAGSATITNNGALYFNGDSPTTMASAGNAYITSNGFVSFGSYSTAGNSDIFINSGSVQFSGNAQGGTAQFMVNNGGDLDISSGTANSVTVGSVESSAGSTINLGANDLAIGINNLSTTISGLIYDSGLAGSLTKLGTGTLTLTDTNFYLGSTTILGGTLAIGNINALGLSSVLLQNGTLAISGSPLYAYIGSNYTQASGGTLQMRLGGSTFGQYDSLDIAGSANLSGSLSVVSNLGFTPTLGDIFLVMTANGVSGNFTSVVNSISGFRFLPVYYPAQVNIVAIQPSFTALGQTFNEKAVGAALDNLYLDPAQQNLMLNLGTQQATALVKAYDQISPAGITPLFQMGFATEESRGALVTKRLADLWDQADSQSQIGFAGKGGQMFASTMSPSQEAAIGNSSSSNQWNVFINGLGDFGTITGDANAPGYQFSIGGMAAGMDYRFSRDLVGGLLLGFTSSGTSQSLSSVDSSGGQVGLYGGWKSGGFYLDGLADGGVNNYTTIRASYVGIANGTTRGTQYGFLLGAGYDWKVDQMKVGPMVMGQYTYVQANAFQETGSTMTPLSFPNQGQGDFTSQLGVKASRNWDLGGLSLGPNLSVAWEHIYQGSLDQLQAGLGTSTNLFTVDGPALGTNAAIIVAGLNAQFGNGLSAQAQYQGNVGMTGYSSQGLSVGLNLGF